MKNAQDNTTPWTREESFLAPNKKAKKKTIHPVLALILSAFFIVLLVLAAGGIVLILNLIRT